MLKICSLFFSHSNVPQLPLNSSSESLTMDIYSKLQLLRRILSTIRSHFHNTAALTLDLLLEIEIQIRSKG